MRNFKTHLTSLKGLACIFIMIGHYVGVIKYAQEISIDTSFIYLFKKYHLFFLIDETFWLSLFFIISGYLCAKSEISKFSHLIIKSITRFFRLAFPIFFACTIILLISHLIGFHNLETVNYFKNSQFQNAYLTKLSVTMLIKSPIDVLISSKCFFNSPYWVLQNMLIASLFIYLLVYMKSKITSLKIYSFFIFTIIFGVFILNLKFNIFYSTIIFGCFLGAIISLYEEQIEKFIDNKMAIITFILSIIIYLLYPNLYTSIFLFATSVLFIPKITLLDKLLKNKILEYLGKISFGIYSFHWPVICSMGSLVIVLSWNKINPVFSITLTSAFSIFATIVISDFYNITAEKWSTKIVKNVKEKLELFITKKE